MGGSLPPENAIVVGRRIALGFLLLLAVVPGAARTATSATPGSATTATTAATDGEPRRPFAALPPGDKDVARALYKAQKGPRALTLDEIAKLRQRGLSWQAVFAEMKARGTIAAATLSEVLRPASRVPVAVVIAEGTTLQRTERLLFDDAGVVGRRTPVRARFLDLRLTAAEYGRLLRDIQRLRDLPLGSRVLFEGSIDGRDFSAELHRERHQFQIRTEGLGFRSREEAQTFVDSFAPEAPSRLRVRGMIDGYRVEVRPRDDGKTPSAAPTPAPAPSAPAVPTVPPPEPVAGPLSPPVPTPTPTPRPAPSGGTARLVALAPDPSSGGIGIGGFSRNHWITSRAAMLSPFGMDGDGPFGDNSLRLYDPVKNVWTYVWPRGPANGGVQKRDNHGSFYVPALDEFWVWGGSYMEAYEPKTGVKPYRSGRFSFETNRWVAVSDTNVGAFAGLVKDGPPFFGLDTAMAWSADLDMGVMFGGETEGNPVNTMYLIERNPAGPERYRATPFTGPRPPARYQAHNLLVAAGKDFYLFGGPIGPVGSRQYVRDFWKFDGVARVWSRLPDPPVTGDTPAVTYDSDRRAVVAWVNARLLAYPIDGNRWLDVTPPGLPCVFNQMAVYAPSAKLHIFQGGNRCDGGAPGLRVVGVVLPDVLSSSPTPPGPEPPRPTPAPAPAPSPAQPMAPGPVVLAPPPSREPAPEDPSPSVDGRVTLPLKTWTKVPLPAAPNGPCTAPYGCKHVRAAVNLRNGRIYFSAGDYEHSNYPSTFSYAIADNTWRLEYPPCGPAGDVAPWVLDQTTWAYDSKRNLFYWTGGYSWGESNQSAPKCPADRSQRVGPALTFDPIARRWSRSPFSAQPTGGSQSTQHSVYDPVTDTVIHLAYYGGSNSAVILRLDSNRWETVSLPATDDGHYINDGDWVEDNQPAIDVEGRAVYLVDRGPENRACRLLRYNIDRRTMTWLGPTPECPGGGENIPLLAWDSINKVLYWLTARENLYSVIWAYRPATRTWEKLGMFTADGVQARGNLLVFDPLQNALLLMGGVNWNNEPDPSFLKYLFLYRYGDGGN